MGLLLVNIPNGRQTKTGISLLTRVLFAALLFIYTSLYIETFMLEDVKKYVFFITSHLPKHNTNLK